MFSEILNDIEIVTYQWKPYLTDVINVGWNFDISSSYALYVCFRERVLSVEVMHLKGGTKWEYISID